MLGGLIETALVHFNHFDANPSVKKQVCMTELSVVVDDPAAPFDIERT